MSKKEAFFRLVGFWFFPIQFVAVWVCFFGLTDQPTILQLYNAFGVEKIIGAVLKFVALLPFKAFTAGKLFYFLVLLIPSLIGIALTLWRFALFVVVLFQFAQWAVANVSVFARKIKTVSDAVRVIVKIGAPGSGKSSSGGYEAVARAQKAYTRLKWYYWRYSGKVAKWQAQGNAEMLERWNEVREAYEFYNAHTDCIPCLWSNIPLEDLCGVKANELTLDHLYQRKRLPVFSVLFLDEVGQTLGVDLSNDKDFDLSDLLRCCRHFGEFYIIATEQSAENIYIDFRRVVGYNEYMQGQKWTGKPFMLLAVFNAFKTLFTALQRGAKRFAPAMDFLSDMIQHIGYRKYTYSYEKNTERKKGLFSGKGNHVYYLPSALNYKYDERTYRKFYKPREQALEPRIYGSLVLDPETETGRRYLRDKERTTAEKAADKAELERIAETLMKSSKAENAFGVIGKFNTRDSLVKAMAANKAVRDILTKLADKPPDG